MAKDTALQTLAALLQAGRTCPDVSLDRFAPSAIYDLDSRKFIIAAAFEIHAKPYLIGYRLIASARLKLLQFVAMRLWLLDVIRQWSQTQKHAQQSILSPQQLRRRFLGDDTHDQVIAFLIARGALQHIGAHIVTGSDAEFLNRIFSAGIEMFASSTNRDLPDMKLRIFPAQYYMVHRIVEVRLHVNLLL